MSINIRWYKKHAFSLNGMEIFRHPDLSAHSGLPPQNDIEMYPLKKEEIPQLMELHDTKCIEWNHIFTREDVEDRLASGQTCICSWYKGQLAGFIWLAPRRVFSPELRCMFETDSTGVFEYNAFVNPDHRRMHVGLRLLDKACQEFAEKGFKTMYSYFRISNQASRKGNTHLGFKKVGRIYYGYLLGYYYFIPSLSREPGVQVRLCASPWHRWQTFVQKRVSAA